MWTRARGILWVVASGRTWPEPSQALAERGKAKDKNVSNLNSSTALRKKEPTRL